MKAKVRTFRAAYRKSLRDCLAGAGEFALLHGYELGRKAIRNGLGVMDMLSIQHAVLLELLAEAETVEECTHLVKSSQVFFIECLSPFELTHRGFFEMESLNHQLEAANKELESFGYSVSHDLRAPLRAIDGYSRMILKKQGGHFNEETRRQFSLIRNNVETMGHLIDGLLAFSRSGRQAMTNVILDMEEIIKEVWQNLLTIHPERKMTLSVEGMRPAMGDRSLIREVVSNLLGNAVKFTRTREMARIEAGSRVEGDETVYYIRDNGIGFDMEYYDKVFGLFQRLHGAAEYEGTGIGLPLVQRIIDRHGGRVWAESENDKGATFYFSLPIRHD